MEYTTETGGVNPTDGGESESDCSGWEPTGTRTERALCLLSAALPCQESRFKNKKNRIGEEQVGLNPQELREHQRQHHHSP